ncbi:iron(III) transport system permease protein [Arthrobacter ginsengisoli]|uniref:Iron(III) transport system permease protein n=1 Tax=Arthrobacter ginsengisoli TaxID=1356565 RepID=A0ABU1UDQ7_9MICC|nr:ABC transporter permease subunit [Arthrobacter ginsengisoli]MDR7083261.1 iron(III) transport system permease protein [Arthrobacter ginsengisoli]
MKTMLPDPAKREAEAEPQLDATTMAAAVIQPTRLRKFRPPTPFTALSLLLALIMMAITLSSVGTVLVSLFVSDKGFSLAPTISVLTAPSTWELVRATAIITGSSTIIATLIGGGLAWLNERTDSRMGVFSDLLPLMSFLLPPVAGSLGYIFLFAPNAGYVNQAWRALLSVFGVVDAGPLLDIYSWSGLIIVFSVYGVPFTYMMIAPALRMMDSGLEEAARMSGAGPLRTMFRVTLPAVMPAMGAGAFLWIWISFSMVDIPLMIGTSAQIDVLSSRIVQLLAFSYPADRTGAVSLSLIITFVVLVAWFIQSRILRAGKHATVGGKGAKTTPVNLGRWRTPARILVVAYSTVTILLPALALLYVALAGTWRAGISLEGLGFAEFGKMFTNVYTLEGLRNSFGLGIVTATIVVIIAAIIALYVSRAGSLTGRLVDAGIKLPATLGTLILVVGMVLLFTGAPFYLGGTLLILLIAYAVISLPNASVSADAAAAGVSNSLSEAARMSGASESRTFVKVILPLLIPGLVGAWASVFVRAFGDLTASSMLSGANNPVIGFQILEQSRYGSYATTATLSFTLAVVSTITVLGAVWFGRWSSRWTQGVSARTRKR